MQKLNRNESIAKWSQKFCLALPITLFAILTANPTHGHHFIYCILTSLTLLQLTQKSLISIPGGIGLAWSILWFIFIYETPASHPRISPEERREIEEAIGTSTSKQRPSYVPWLSILSSPCVWAIIVTHGCSVFGYFTVVNQLPTYMKKILHFNIKEVIFCRLKNFCLPT